MNTANATAMTTHIGECEVPVKNEYMDTCRVHKFGNSHNCCVTAARENDVETLKRIHAESPLSRDEVTRQSNNLLFRIAAAYGHIPVASWLLHTFKLTSEDIKSDNNDAFWQSAHNDHRIMYAWLEGVADALTMQRD